MKILAIALFAACSVACAQWNQTVGCYSETELALGYDHSFTDSSFNSAGGDDHGNEQNHLGGISGEAFSEDRIGVGATIHFKPGACP